MKNISVLILFSFLFFSCKQQLYSLQDLENKEGLYYVKENKKLYTGETKDFGANLVIDTFVEVVIINTFKEGEHLNSKGYSLDEKTLRFDYNYSNGKKNSYWKEYHENGQLALEKSYKNGIEEGLFAKYYENGQKEYEYTVINGKAINSDVTYYDNGNLKTKYDSLGNEYYYYKSGNILMEKKGGKEVFYDEKKNQITYEQALIEINKK